MARAVEDLTDREKEVLRLLLAGHTAKSAAAELDLSVHTVNDYLREARKKLGVTSSREAARILAESEAAAPSPAPRTAPDKDAPDQIGIPPPADRVDNRTAMEGWSPSNRVALWIIGGIAMTALVLALALLAGTSGAPNGATEQGAEKAMSEQERATAASAAAARDWVALIDQDQWETSWQRAGTTFRGAVTAETWESQAKPVRDPLGAVESRRVAGVTKYDELPGMPAGKYEIVEFRTDFAQSAGRTETVVMTEEAQGWKVIGYFVK